ncbi:MAG: carboxypeptidase-like regulatory domain-containing protein [Reichenbachiella sp.]|uniref:carboxypeptidase-like regulatory domain-containing protein n=1 Tax=Reichenbachiella sp. TaxID=2184521 RepID=UPI00326751A7
MLKLLPTLFATILWGQANAQISDLRISGQILDAKTHLPIAFAHVLGSTDQVVSDHLGQFSIKVRLGDTLTFSHINFDRYALKVLDRPENRLIIYLSPKENLMKEIIIREYMPEDEFKLEILKHEVQITKEEANAVNNVAYSTMLYRKGYVPEMNSLDNFKNYIKEPRGITLFSSDPNKGLIRSIKKLNQQNKSYNLNGLNLNRVKTDSLSNNLFYVPAK